MKVIKVKKTKLSSPDSLQKTIIGDGFLLENKASMPDIDIDFDSDSKPKVIGLLEGKYNADGTQNVFSVGSFTTLKIKAAFKDVARSMKLPFSLTNYISAIIDPDWTIEGFFKGAIEAKPLRKFIDDYPKVVEGMMLVLNQHKAPSIHASAVVVTPKHLNGKRVECFDYLPIKKNKDGVLVSEWDGNEVDYIGLLKNDVLATQELKTQGETMKVINKERPEVVKGILKSIGVTARSYLELEDIQSKLLQDDKVYELFTNGFTQNIFQFGGISMTKFISEMIPTNINDLIAATALHRPSTMEIGAHNDYIKYKNGEAEPIYDWGTSDITGETYSIYTYQEQAMLIAVQLAGFSLTKADVLRKAIGKKKADLMATLREDFISGITKNGCSKEEADVIWHKIELGGKYSFNKSHAAAYTLESYRGAWMKANFPVASYMIALQDANDKNIPDLLGEIPKASNCQVMPPDINNSTDTFTADFENSLIFWSLGRIKFVGSKAVDLILRLRETFKSKSFTEFYEFINKLIDIERQEVKKNGERYTNPINVRVFKNLILAGCFDQLHCIRNPVERLPLIEDLYKLNGGVMDKKEFPDEQIYNHFFWSQKQIEICGFGYIDYERIYNESGLRNKYFKYRDLKECLSYECENKNASICCTIESVSESSGKAKGSGNPYKVGRLLLRQNMENIELSIWNEDWERLSPIFANKDGSIAILSGRVRYNDFSKKNTFGLTKNSTIRVM